VNRKALIAGLGNPGREYAANRHNVGFQCLDRLAARHRLHFGRVQSNALITSGRIGERGVVLAKPQAFMNVSGRPVAALARFYQVALTDLLVVYDDIDLPFGMLRLRMEGSAGGHNGMRSIIEHLGTQAFPRLRLGIGRPPGRRKAAGYVLENFSRAEAAEMEDTYARAVDAIETWLRDGIAAAMNLFNQKSE